MPNYTRFGGDGVAAKDIVIKGADGSDVSVSEKLSQESGIIAASGVTQDDLAGLHNKAIGDLYIRDLTASVDEMSINLSNGNVNLGDEGSTGARHTIFTITAGHATNVLQLDMSSGRVVIILNSSAGNCLVRNQSSDTAITIASGKAAILCVDSNYIVRRVTADSALT